MTFKKTLGDLVRGKTAIRPYGAFAVAMAVALGLNIALGDTTVDLTVNMENHVVETRADTVGDLLTEVGITDPNLLVDPSPETKLEEGLDIYVLSPQDLSLSLPSGALLVQGLTASSRDVSRASRGLQRQPLATVTLKASSGERSFTTRSTTVGDFLKAQGVTLGENQRVSLPLDTPLSDGMTIEIQEITTGSVTEVTSLPYETERRDDPSLLQGTEKVVTPGVEGQVSTVYRVTYANGVEVSREKSLEATLTQVQNEVILVGTKKPAPVVTVPVVPSGGGAVAPGSNRALGQSLAAARGWSGSEWTCLDALWTRESGWNHLVANKSSGAYGIPQALPGSKMSSAGGDWATNPSTQISWGLGYIAGRYGTPCEAWGHSEAVGWY